jgi:CheY-like chemotaxis protein
LIVDDIAANIRVAEGLLAPYAMKLDASLSGKEALELAERNAYDLVLMDHLMDGMDGVAAACALKKLPGHAATPVVAMTANALTGMREFFLDRGFADYISKPVDPAALDVVLTRWIPEEKRAAAPQAGPAPSPTAVRAELARHRLDLLNHYRWHFVSDLPADRAYCENFSALVEVMDVSPRLRGDMASLAAAGRRGDTAKIRRLLPDVYEAIATAMREGEKDDENARDESAAQGFAQTLAQLKRALDTGDGHSADAALGAMRTMAALNDNERELYFFLYDALLMGETEKAAGRLAVWMDGFGRQG